MHRITQILVSTATIALGGPVLAIRMVVDTNGAIPISTLKKHLRRRLIRNAVMVRGSNKWIFKFFAGIRF